MEKIGTSVDITVNFVITGEQQIERQLVVYSPASSFGYIEEEISPDLVFTIFKKLTPQIYFSFFNFFSHKFLNHPQIHSNSNQNYHTV